jgi:hypothetical protein
MRYSKWDEVILKVEDRFGYRDKVYSRLKVMVLGFDADNDSDSAQYLCYVPAYERVPYGFPTFTITKQHLRYFGVEDKFLGDTGCFITARMAIFKHLPAPKGEKCDKCGDFGIGAVRSDGVYLCRPCRENPYR